jgi:hypothetical protein
MVNSESVQISDGSTQELRRMLMFLPNQTDALASLGGNCLFSTMDLMAGFYNISQKD